MYPKFGLLEYTGEQDTGQTGKGDQRGRVHTASKPLLRGFEKYLLKISTELFTYFLSIMMPARPYQRVSGWLLETRYWPGGQALRPSPQSPLLTSPRPEPTLLQDAA